MCIVCVLWEKGKLTNDEARKALSEVSRTTREEVDHQIELIDKIETAEKSVQYCHEGDTKTD